VIWQARVAGDRGQASVELVAVIPVIVALCFALWQGLVYGQAAWLAGAAARAAARAEAVGGDAGAAARSRLPAALRHGLRVTTGHDGAVAVRIRVPLVVTGRSLGTVSARAQMESQR
jgi:TadE-like protein